ncbi:hypothetical protein [Pseudomarimonas arenosa]|uniref:Uncharacterized protein n=1 Tax=Pseudomarimonas arenosa TaxID=2774145 RepID=A0AAW3ZJS6_9GAMM|nr:hypothetical protein [Pseudomarimonas arenosa]MBD8526335.1 hypothetical protein [Pseudomarimonas arenosa]
MYSFRFRSETFGGFAEVTGIAKLDDGGLELQFQARDAVFGVLKSEIKSRRVSLGQLLQVSYHAGPFWLLPRVELHLHDLLGAEELPGGAEGTVKLGVKWSDRAAAKRATEWLQRLLHEQRFQSLQTEIEQLSRSHPKPVAAWQATALTGASSPPPPPPRLESE